MKIPAQMGHKFSEVPKAEIQRSQFDRSFGYKTTFDAGYLIPFYVDEALPGDTFQMRTQCFIRLATPLKPIMDNMTVETFYFAIPYRLVWTNFRRFMGEQINPDDSTDYIIPVTGPGVGAGYAVGSIFDYMGIPTGVDNFEHSVLPLRAYNLVWVEFFRDQNIQDAVSLDRGDGPETSANFALLRRGKRHDYFTSCLPWPQKGDAVSLPLGTFAPVIPNAATAAPTFKNVAAGVTGGLLLASAAADSPAVKVSSPVGDWLLNSTLQWDATQLSADLTNATAATINELRQAFQLQKLLERDARGGTRYIEKIKAHFGVTSPDARLQRPEYLGGGSSPLIVSPIAQTSETGAGTPQGNLAAIGTSAFGGHGFVKSFTEHTIVLGLISVRADLTYQQGLHRQWTRSTQYDFYWPALAHIGEQAVTTGELYLTGVPAEDDVIFGYQERYAEYRYRPSQITGLFRSEAAGSLDLWHLAQHIGGGETWDPVAPPTLSPDFIVENPPVDRVIAVPTEPHFLMDSHSILKCARPMPLYGVPGLIDHF